VHQIEVDASGCGVRSGALTTGLRISNHSARCVGPRPDASPAAHLGLGHRPPRPDGPAPRASGAFFAVGAGARRSTGPTLAPSSSHQPRRSPLQQPSAEWLGWPHEHCRCRHL